MSTFTSFKVGDSVIFKGVISDSITKLSKIFLSNFEDGFISIKINYTDSAGNQSDPVGSFIYKDTKEPILSIKKMSNTNLKAIYTIESNEIISNSLTKDNMTINFGVIDSVKKVSNTLFNVFINRICNDTLTISIKPNSLLDTVGNKNLITTFSTIEKLIPVVPIVKDTNYCFNATSDTLRAASIAGATLLWYGINPTGGKGTNIPIKPSTDNIGTINYYLSQVITATGCEGARAKISVTIKPLPSAPIVTNATYCLGSTPSSLIATPIDGSSLKWYGSNVTGGSASGTAPLPSTSIAGTFNYYVSQLSTTTGCESPRSNLIVSVFDFPTAPILSRDLNNFLVANSNSITWYKDGVQLSDTSQKIKPSVGGFYTAKTTQNGCISALSAPYYFIVTNVINLSSSEFIKLAPNPVKNYINIDFVIKGFQRLNVDFYELSTGLLKYSNKGVFAGSQLFIGQLSPGTYVVSVRSDDGKVAHKLKIIKL